MNVTFATLGLGALTVDEQLEIVGQLWDEVTAKIRPETLMSEAQAKELDRRLTDIEANPDDWVSWDEIRADVRLRHQP